MLSQPIRTFVRLYGASNYVSQLVSKRTERFMWQTTEPRQLAIIFELLAQYIPMQIGFKPLYIANLMYLEYANSYKTYRHLFNLPVNGQRT